jgi:uncharacterized protein (DUF433 family)
MRRFAPPGLDNLDQADVPEYNRVMNDLIAVDPNVLVGKPVIAGTRIPVSLILNLLAHGYDFDRIIRAYPVLTREQVKAAIKYSEDRLNREEIRILDRTV